MSEPFPEIVRSRAVVLRGDNIDTDVITPIARVVEGGDAVVRFAFEPLRFAPDGSPLLTDPFADPERQGAQILIAGENFGCGSSRETAATAVRGMGFRVVVAPQLRRHLLFELPEERGASHPTPVRALQSCPRVRRGTRRAVGGAGAAGALVRGSLD
ncbi:MAG: hypothetical protein WDM85_12695 [Caulobacteraceae bacterium]